MKKNNLICFARSLVLLPVMTMSFSLGSLGTAHNASTLQNVLVKKVNIDPVRGSLAEVLRTHDFVASETSNGIEANGALALNQAIDPKALELQAKADAIDSYFSARDMPLEGLGLKMAQEADSNNIDWRLLPAIAVRESTGGKNACDKVTHNSFGWGSCKIGFNSDEEAIETVARNLGGNNPNTAKHYDNKTTKQILQKYNPPSVVLRYAQQVMSIMKDIGDTNITASPSVTT